MDKYIEEMANRTGDQSPERIVEKAAAIAGENLELRWTVDTLRGRLREARRATVYYHRQYESALRYRRDAEDNRARFREIAVALVGAAVMVTCLAFVGAVCWGWWHG